MTAPGEPRSHDISYEVDGRSGIGACPAYGCGPLMLTETTGEAARVHCPRCFWGSTLDRLLA